MYNNECPCCGYSADDYYIGPTVEQRQAQRDKEALELRSLKVDDPESYRLKRAKWWGHRFLRRIAKVTSKWASQELLKNAEPIMLLERFAAAPCQK